MQGYIVLPQFFPYLVPVWTFSAWWLLDHDGGATTLPAAMVDVDDTPTLAVVDTQGQT